MDFQQLIINEMSDSQATVWREQSPYATSIGLNSFVQFAQKYKQYKSRLSEEQRDYNSAIKSVCQNRDETFRENQRRIAREHENQLARRKRNKIIIIVSILTFVFICAVVSLVLFISCKNTELEDGALVVVVIDSGVNDDTLIVPETCNKKAINVIIDCVNGDLLYFQTSRYLLNHHYKPVV